MTNFKESEKQLEKNLSSLIHEYRELLEKFCEKFLLELGVTIRIKGNYRIDLEHKEVRAAISLIGKREIILISWLIPFEDVMKGNDYRFDPPPKEDIRRYLIFGAGFPSNPPPVEIEGFKTKLNLLFYRATLDSDIILKELT